MGYIGNEPTTGHFPVDNLVGAPAGTYTLTQAPASAGAIEVSVGGVLQPTTAYSVTGTTLTMAGVATGIPIFVRHLGETLSLPTPADGSVTDAKIVGMNASKLTGTIDNARISLDAAEVPSLDAAKITTGTFDNARVSAASVTQHVPAVDLTAVRQDIAMLALYNAVSDNRAAYNLPYSFIDQFEDDTGLATQTDVDRDTAGEFVSSVSFVSGAYTSDSDTLLLIHSDATNGSTSFTDSSSDGRVVTPVGNCQHATAQKKFGASSIYCDGTGSGASMTKLTVADSDDWAFSGDHTIDMWVRPDNLSNYGWLVAFGPDGGWGLIPWNALMFQTTGTVRHQVSNNGSAGLNHTTASGLSATTWTHIAWVRSGNVWTTYFNGTSVVSNTNAQTVLNYASRICFGGSDNIYPFTGYLDEIRISDTARWTGTGAVFTPNADSSVDNATGTLVSDVQTAPAATTKMSGVILYKDNGSGATTLGTQLKIYLTANLQGTSPNWTGTDWKEVVAGDFGTVTPLFSAGVKMVRIAEQTVVSGTATAMKAVWASQASGTLETQLHGWAMNY